ncbi:MAG: DUF2607 family protein [Thermodesulfobacteriota bacterium]|nr:DUF2607 family protein [Thermodesulfobacteriota bacterium]
MKYTFKVHRILSILIFISSIALYILFASVHPLLHNHYLDDEHHHNCPACHFLAVASFSIVPGAVIIPSVFFQVSHQRLFGYKQLYKQVFLKGYFTRSPPIISA